MGSRKRPKPNPKADVESQLPAQPDTPKPEGEALPCDALESAVRSEKSQAIEAASSSNVGPTTSLSTKSWYGGTWPRGNKAASVTQVAKESISASGGAASNLVARARPDTPNGSLTPPKNPAPYLSRSIASSSRSLPLAATTTKLNITSNASSIPNSNSTVDQEPKSVEVASKEQPTKSLSASDKGPEQCDPGKAQEEHPVSHDPSSNAAESDCKPTSEDGAGNDTSGWLGWFSKPSQPNDRNPDSGRDAQGDCEATSAATNGLSSLDPISSQKGKPLEEQRRNSEPNPIPVTSQQERQPRSWLSLWSNTNVPSENSIATLATESTSATFSQEIQDTQKPEQPKVQSTDVSHSRLENSPQTADSARSQGWSFWSNVRSKEDHRSGALREEIGKLALAGSPSQYRPENAAVDQARGLPRKLGKRDRLQSLEVTDDASPPEIMKGEAEKRENTKATRILPNTNPTELVRTKAQRTIANLLLPPFKHTYSVAEKPSILQHLSRILQYTQVPDARHLDLISSPVRIKKALAIGVHGYFPAPLIRSVLGQPTGTSIRFANSAASAIQRWTQNHGYSCEVEKVALEGEGKIAERIDLLWKLMLNWIEKIRKADLVMIACHSQGVPVAISLVAKLISFGCVNTAKIGICAMAGVNLGPFADYKSRWIGGSAGELFDFAQPESQVSKDYEAALKAALKFGVKIIFIGSIDDQLVSLESSTFGIMSHPYIYRAVFVDGRVHAPDFLTHLVGFALKLRNLGISDHGLIRELSSPLAGSLYGGEGHSRVYDDDSVYYLAVEHALETTSLGNLPLKVGRDSPGTSQNPYILPFAIRGLLEEEYVRTELANETAELLRQFDDWKPSSKVLKDVKFRLEGVRSKL